MSQDRAGHIRKTNHVERQGFEPHDISLTSGEGRETRKEFSYIASKLINPDYINKP